MAEDNPYISIIYPDRPPPTRETEVPCTVAHPLIADGAAVPKTDADLDAYRGWAGGDAPDGLSSWEETEGAEAAEPEEEAEEEGGEEAPEAEPEEPEEAAEEEEEPGPAEPETYEAPEGEEGDGWPSGYSYERAGAYYAVFSPDGEKVESDAASGKWQGEDAAQEAAWKHARGDA